MGVSLSMKGEYENLFIVINKQVEPGQYIPVYKSECLGTINKLVMFRTIILDTYKLCNANLDQPVLFVVFQYQNNGSHKKIGSASIELAKFKETSTFDVKLDKRGSIKFRHCVLEERVSFLDYIMGGCEIGVHVAIDFTLSNGKADSPQSLHFLDPAIMRNQYTDAIYTICSIL